ncbi:MAG TPA: hypothetical protein VF678_11430, partial [bacterium]
GGSIARMGSIQSAECNLRQEVAMNRFRSIVLLAGVFAVLAGCQQHGKGPFGTAQAPYPLKVGMTQTVDFSGSEVTFLTFTPTATENHTISLTDNTGPVFWELITPNFPAAGSVQDCNLSADVIDQICVTPVLETGTAYDLRVIPMSGIISSGKITVAGGATPTTIVENTGTVSDSMGNNGSLHYTFTAGAAAVYTVHLTNLDSMIRVSVYTDGSYPEAGPDAGQCVPSSVATSFDCILNDGASLANGTQYFLLLENINFSYADAGANAFDVELTHP